MKDQPTNPAIKALAKALRYPQTPMESKLWVRLRDNRLDGHKFRRQHPIHRFVVDFYCAEARLVVEIDGDSHAAQGQAEHDVMRTEWLEQHGYRVIRFTNEDVAKRIDGVLMMILKDCVSTNPSP